MTDSEGKSLEEKIVDEINKGGYALEIYSAIILKKNGWAVRPSLNFFDADLGNYREADVVAYKQSKIPNIFNILAIECKKSEGKPWVFIRQKRFGYLSENLNIALQRHDWLYYKKLEETMKFHHYSKTAICTYSFVALASKNDPNNKIAKGIYHAKIQVLSILDRLLAQRTAMYQKNHHYPAFTFIYPIIVYDGNLYSAVIDENSVKLHEEKHLILSVEMELPANRAITLGHNTHRDQEYKPFFIDIVKKEYLDEYLNLLEKYYDNIPSLFPSCHQP